MQHAAPSNDIMSPDEAAEYLRISVLMLAKMRWGDTSELPYIKLGRKTIRYRRSDLDRWLAGCLVQNTASAHLAAPAAA